MQLKRLILKKRRTEMLQVAGQILEMLRQGIVRQGKKEPRLLIIFQFMSVK